MSYFTEENMVGLSKEDLEILNKTFSKELKKYYEEHREVDTVIIDSIATKVFDDFCEKYDAICQ
jgi:hypothetical protein